MNGKAQKNKPSLQEVLNDPMVRRELDLAWEESQPNARSVPFGKKGSKKREQGGWIVWNPQTGLLEVIRVPSISRNELGISLASRPQESATRVVVAWFHTHPNMRAEGFDSRYNWGDVVFTRLVARVPCILLSHDGVFTIPC